MSALDIYFAFAGGVFFLYMLGLLQARQRRMPIWLHVTASLLAAVLWPFFVPSTLMSVSRNIAESTDTLGG